MKVKYIFYQSAIESRIFTLLSHSLFSFLDQLADLLAALLADALVISFAVPLFGRVAAFSAGFLNCHFSFASLLCHRITP